MPIRTHLCVVAVLAMTLTLALPVDAQRRDPRRAQQLPTVADLEVGKFVKVKGRVVRDTVIATRVEFYLEPPEEGSLEAVVAALDQESNTLTVLGRTVALSDSTKLRDDVKTPLLLSQVRVGQMAKVRGTLGDDGVITARKIKVTDLQAGEIPEEVKIKAEVEAMDLENDTFVVYGTTVTINANTEYQMSE